MLLAGSPRKAAPRSTAKNFASPRYLLASSAAASCGFALAITARCASISSVVGVWTVQSLGTSSEMPPASTRAVLVAGLSGVGVVITAVDEDSALSSLSVKDWKSSVPPTTTRSPIRAGHDPHHDPNAWPSAPLGIAIRVRRLGRPLRPHIRLRRWRRRRRRVNARRLGATRMVLSLAFRSEPACRIGKRSGILLEISVVEDLGGPRGAVPTAGLEPAEGIELPALRRRHRRRRTLALGELETTVRSAPLIVRSAQDHDKRARTP
jgi:hypothetical protein